MCDKCKGPLQSIIEQVGILVIKISGKSGGEIRVLLCGKCTEEEIERWVRKE
jgi:hypothetical protein